MLNGIDMKTTAEEDASANQVWRAMTENNICETQGMNPPISDSDVDETHLPVHLKRLEGMLVKMREEGSSKSLADSFAQLGSHANNHIERMRSKNMLEQAGVFAGVLQKLANVFDWNEEHFYNCNKNALEHAFISNSDKEELNSLLYSGYSPYLPQNSA